MKPEKKKIELSDDEKDIIKLLKQYGPVDLAALKITADLSGKKWDKAIKSLVNKDLVNVFKFKSYMAIELTEKSINL